VAQCTQPHFQFFLSSLLSSRSIRKRPTHLHWFFLQGLGPVVRQYRSTLLLTPILSLVVACVQCHITHTHTHIHTYTHIHIYIYIYIYKTE
jgi:hypothetical protein